jgi:hypothetical protein
MSRKPPPGAALPDLERVPTLRRGDPVFFAEDRFDFSARSCHFIPSGRLSHDLCVAAEAIADIGGLAITDVEVGRAATYVQYYDSYWLKYRTQNRVLQQLISMDQGGDFLEGDYHLLPIPKNRRKKQRGPHKEKAPPKAVRRDYYIDPTRIRPRLQP